MHDPKGGRTGQLGSNHEVAVVAAIDDNDDGGGEGNNDNLFSTHIISSWFSSVFNNTQKSLTKNKHE